MTYIKSTVTLIKMGLLVFVLVNCQGTLKAQNCDFLDNIPISLNHSAYNIDAAYRQVYAIVSANDTILEIASIPTFTSKQRGDYYVYAINYDTTTILNNFNVGENIANLSGTCLDTTRIAINVCTCPTDCHSITDTISINHTGYNATAGFSQIYVLADTIGNILLTVENPLTTTPLFFNIPNGHYHIYAVNYDTSRALLGLTVGNNMTRVSGDCFDLEGPFCYNVCNNNYDFGDLPDTSDSTTTNDYQTLFAHNGPRHLIIGDLYLGNSIDGDLEGQQNDQASGDGMDDDGIIIFSTMNLAAGISFRLPFAYTNLTGDTAHLEAWVDWNADGDFGAIDEMIIDWEDANAPFPNTLEINIPIDAATEVTIGLRIRLSLQDNMSPYGLVHSGEVEDYLLYLDCSEVYFPFTLTKE